MSFPRINWNHLAEKEKKKREKSSIHDSSVYGVALSI